MSNFKIDLREMNNINVIDLKGYLDAHTAPELEKAFQISISHDEARSIRNVRDVVEGVAKLVAGAALDSAAPEAIK